MPIEGDVSASMAVVVPDVFDIPHMETRSLLYLNKSQWMGLHWRVRIHMVL